MSLKPVLGPVQLTFYAVGMIVGAGVYSVIGGAAGIAQDGLWLSFAIGALVALLTGFSYAEMATAHPIAGAEYIYIRKAAPRADWAAFGVGTIILLGGGATAATVAIGFGGYFRTFFDVPVGVSAFGLIAACTALNIWGIRESSWANMLFTLIEIGGLVLVIAAAVFAGTIAAPLAAPPGPGVMAAATILFFVFLGFEELANVVEEARNPGRDIPRAIFSGLAITTVLYVLVALAIVGLAPPAELAASDAPLVTALAKVWPGASATLSAIALFATANTVLIALVATSRLAFSMGRDRELPEFFATVLAGRGTPWVGCMLAFVLSIVLLPIGDLTVLAGLSSFSALIAFLAVNATLIAMRYQEPKLHRPFRVPLSVGRLPLLPVAAIASILLLLAFFEWEIYFGGAIGIALTAVAFLLQRWWARKRK
ncbi:MAG TPA: amino acid permease [Xanthobacteraceae bacterium]|jgi:amino acid transporter